MNICFLYHNSSRGMGGIQLLIRTLQELFELQGWKNLEVNFFDERSSINDRFDFVDYSFVLNKMKSRTGLSSFGLNAIISRLCPPQALRRADTIIIFNPNMLLAIPLWLLRKKRLILVQTNRFDKFFSSASKILFYLFKRYIDDVTVYTVSDEERFLSLYPGFSRVNVIPRACRLETATQSAILSKRLLFIGRISERSKNFKDLISLMNFLGADYSLSIYGDGEELEVNKLKDLISQTTNVTYEGPALNVGEVYPNYSVFVMTSHYEGFGNTLIEARSQGLPIVAFDTFDALHWIVDDFRNGRIIPYRDISSMGEAIRLITSAPDIFNSYSCSALSMASSTDKEVISKCWVSLLKG